MTTAAAPATASDLDRLEAWLHAALFGCLEVPAPRYARDPGLVETVCNRLECLGLLPRAEACWLVIEDLALGVTCVHHAETGEPRGEMLARAALHAISVRERLLEVHGSSWSTQRARE